MLTPRATAIPIRSPRPARPARRSATDGLLLVAHGSSCLAGVDEVRALGEAAAAASPGLAVDLGFLELADPPAGPVLDDLVTRGCRRVTVQPLMLLAAGHGKSDVPAIVLEGRARHPGVEVLFGSPLGVVPELLAIAASNLAAAGGAGLPLLVVARGTSDPDANAEACRAARLLAEWTGAPDVDVAFTGVTWPSVPAALERVRRLGHQALAVFFWFLATGKLVERARGQLGEFAETTGVAVADVGYFGPDPALVPVIHRRRAEAIEGLHRTNCDTCSYRAEWPGMADRVAQPRGLGHSALAADHRRSHGHRR
ncbi:MAG: sirohydrochlorin chelatase [Actinobacteria bacterium]|nr:sirohydrochlorin chelatase [Actinomycetota bacterium]